MGIFDKQMAVVAEFDELPDWEARYEHIIGIGRGLSPLGEEHRIKANKVRGCSSQVWLTARFEDGLVHFDADSDAVIVRGLVALLLRVYSGHRPSEIIGADPAFIEELGLNQNLSSNRANGLAAMVARIKTEAEAFA
jgi:cysteine desulfuration protein SufE